MTPPGLAQPPQETPGTHASAATHADETLKFGIDSLDKLLDEKGAGMKVPAGEATSFCLIGPDGTGKSVFSLHLASRYLESIAERDARSKVIYVSTDLRWGLATKMAKSFGLCEPKDLDTADYSQLAEFILDSESRAV